MVWCDDVTLLAPSRQALQVMLNICEEFSLSHSMQFSTDPSPQKSKTKCLLFSRTLSEDQVAKVSLNGNLLPWVKTAKHLGNHLSSKLNFSFCSPENRTDLLQKRAIFFERVHQLLQQFGQYHPRLVLNLLKIYSTAFYGSSLWQISSEEFSKLTRSWNTAVKMVWDLPPPTHKRFLESLSPAPHLESTLDSRYLGFAHGLVKSEKCIVKLIITTVKSDLGTMTGHNLNFIMLKYKQTSIGNMLSRSSEVKWNRVNPVVVDEEWKLALIEEISLARKDFINIDFDDSDLEEFLEYVCTN